jgi:hypothetical protein
LADVQSVAQVLVTPVQHGPDRGSDPIDASIGAADRSVVVDLALVDCA